MTAVYNTRPASKTSSDYVDVVRTLCYCAAVWLALDVLHYFGHAYRGWILGVEVGLVADWVSSHKTTRATLRILRHVGASVQATKAGCAAKTALTPIVHVLRKILPSVCFCVAMAVGCPLLYNNMWVVRSGVGLLISSIVLLVLLKVVVGAVGIALMVGTGIVWVAVKLATWVKPHVPRASSIVGPVLRTVKRSGL